MNKTYTLPWKYVNKDLLCFTANEATTIAFTWEGTGTKTLILKYRINLGTWNDYTLNTNITLSAGDKCYWYGNNSTINLSSGNDVIFTSTGNISASGNITSLLSRTCATTIPEYCFRKLFYNCTKLLTAPELPATTLGTNCYASMFEGCTSLTIAPALPATLTYSAIYNKGSAYCYSNMFSGCTSLTTAPELPSLTLAYGCYSAMFSGCTSLITPPALPSTSTVQSCYDSMFIDCTNLTSVPNLKATSLHTDCYKQMFNGCISLYISDTQTSSASNIWIIPSTGAVTALAGGAAGTWMFENCLGTRSTDSPNFLSGNTYTYYTQNEPIE